MNTDTLHGPCTECGTTQTPLWRDGPTGPRTLCNACGVRRNRERRRKGRPVHKFPPSINCRIKPENTQGMDASNDEQSPVEQKASEKDTWPHDPECRSMGEETADENAVSSESKPDIFGSKPTCTPHALELTDQENQPVDQKYGASNGRPVRKAAIASMMSTKRITSKRAWREDDGTSNSSVGKKQVTRGGSRGSGRGRGKYAATAMKTRGSGRPSLSATLRGRGRPRGRGGRSGELNRKQVQESTGTEEDEDPSGNFHEDSAILGQDCAAAIHLLSMRVRGDGDTEGACDGNLDDLMGSILLDIPMETRLPSMKYAHRGQLPDDQMLELQKIEDEVLQARWEVHSAEVAASAVAKSLAVRTAAAARARARYAQACSRLQGFISGVSCGKDL